jgi:hypothetical protein
MNKSQLPEDYPQSISEAYELITKALLSDDQKLVAKAWKFINEAQGDWVWVRAKLITSCYEAADAEGREEFCHLTLQEHIEKGRATPLAQLFVDESTGIQYQEFLMFDGTIYRIPITTPEMDKHVFQKALNKMFVGDFIKSHSVDGVEYTLLDTQEKVDAYNEGIYYEKYVFKRTIKKSASRSRVRN